MSVHHDTGTRCSSDHQNILFVLTPENSSRTGLGGAVLDGCEEAIAGGVRSLRLLLPAPARLHLEAFPALRQRAIAADGAAAGAQLPPQALQGPLRLGGARSRALEAALALLARLLLILVRSSILALLRQSC